MSKSGLFTQVYEMFTLNYKTGRECRGIKQGKVETKNI